MYSISTNSNLRLLHFCFALDPELAGVAKGVTDICVHTCNFGISHEIASFGNSRSSLMRGKIFTNQLEKMGIQVSSGRSILSNQYGIGSLLFAIKLLFRRPETDAIVLHQVYTFSTLWGWIVGKLHSIPIMVFPHGSLTSYHERDSRIKKNIAKKVFVKKVIRDCELLIATSESEKHEIEKLTGKNVVIISYGFDSIIVQRKLQFWINPNLLFVGRFTEKKNLDKLIMAMKILKSDYPEIKLNAVGYRNKSEIASLRKLIANLGLEECVNLVPWATKDLLKSFYQTSDVFVLVSENENFGLVVAEALSNGLPCLVSKEVALSAQIKDRNAGIVISDSEPRTISEGVKKCLDSSFLDRKANAQKLVQLELSWESVSWLWKRTVDEIYN